MTFIPNIKGTHYDITTETRVYIEEKIAQFSKLIRVNEDAVTCDVEVEREMTGVHGNVWRVEINVRAAGDFYRTEAKGETINAAVDEAKDEMMRVLRRSKRKGDSLLRRGGAKLKEWLRFGS